MLSKSGFTLVEIIIVIVVAGVVAAALAPFMGSALTRSHEPVKNLQDSLNLSSVMAKIVAEYRTDTPGNVNDLKDFRDKVEGFVNNNANLTINEFIKFIGDEGEEGEYKENDCDQDEPDEDCVLKVQIRSHNNPGESLMVLFNYRLEGELIALITRGDIELTGSSRISGNVKTVYGDVFLGFQTGIDGDLTVSSVNRVNRPQNVTGEIDEDSAPYEFCEFSPDTSGCGCSFPSGCNDFQTTWYNTELSLSDGDCFNEFNVESNRTLAVEVGDNDREIFVGSLNDGSFGHIRIDPAPGTGGLGRLLIYVKNTVSFLSSSSVNQNGDPEKFILYYAGGTDVVLDGAAQFNGALFAPDALVDIRGSSVLRGYVEADSFKGGAAGGERLVSSWHGSFMDYCGFVYAPLPEIPDTDEYETASFYGWYSGGSSNITSDYEAIGIKIIFDRLETNVQGAGEITLKADSIAFDTNLQVGNNVDLVVEVKENVVFLGEINLGNNSSITIQSSDDYPIYLYFQKDIYDYINEQWLFIDPEDNYEVFIGEDTVRLSLSGPVTIS